MKRNIKNEMKIAKKSAILMMLIGIMMAFFGILFFVNRDTLQLVPRMDIAWMGFLVVATLCLISGISLFISSIKEREWINETDEREISIMAHSSLVGYLVQTILLVMMFFILTFMGFLNKVSDFSILAIIIISGITSGAYNLYLRKNGME